MQDIEKIDFEREEIEPFELESKHRESQSRVEKSKVINYAVRWAKPKDYSREHRAEFITAVSFLCLASIVSVFFGQFTIIKLLEIQDNSFVIAWHILASIVIGLIYYLEYINLTNIARSLKLNRAGKDKVPVSLQRWIMAIVISLFNIALVTSGVYLQTKKNDTIIQSVEIAGQKDSARIALEYNQEIGRIQGQISNILENAKKQWHGVMTGEDKKLVNQYEQTLSALRSNKALDLEKLKTDHSAKLTEKKQNLADVILYKILVAALLEIIVIFSSISIGNYFTGILVERAEKRQKKKLSKQKSISQLN